MGCSGCEGPGSMHGAEEGVSVSHLWTLVLPTQFRLTERLPCPRETGTDSSPYPAFLLL